MKSFIFTMVLLLSLSFVTKGQEVVFQGQAQSSVLLGEKFQLVYTLNTTGSDLRLPDLDDFQILMGPSTSKSYSMTSINGVMKQETTLSFTYILKSNKEGRLTIPPASIVVKGEKIMSNPVVINVVKGDARSAASGDEGAASREEVGNLSSEDLFVTQTLNKSSVYQGEGVVLTTRIYTRLNIDGISDIKQPELSQFVVQDLIGPEAIQWNVENVNGRTYNVGVYQSKVLLPQKSGKITIEPIDFEFMVKQRVARRSSSIFDDFFESNQRLVKSRVKSKPLSLTVKSLPTPEPESFTGGVGNFNMKVSLSKDKVKADDGITLTLDVTGEGNLRILEGPKLKFPTDFDIYDPKVSSNLNVSGLGAKGTKTFEYLIIPRHAGSYSIPAIEFSFFNPSDGRYKTVTAGPFNIEVEKGDASSASSAQSFRGSNSREEVKYLGQDIRFIKNSSEGLKPIGSFILGSFSFSLGIIVPLALFVLALLLYRKRMFEDANVHLVKNRKATKIARKRLVAASRFLKEDKKEAFYDEVMRALWGYLSDKLNLPLSELTKDNAKAEMVKHGVDEALSAQFMEVLDNCEFARYAPSAVSGTMADLYQKTMDIISELENQIK
ncbi:MAG: BatD family protein [Breznakibacter sp.]